MKEKRELVRIVRSENGEAKLDLSGKANGRGAYVCSDEQCLRKAVKSRALERALEAPVSPETLEQLAAVINKRTADEDAERR